MSRVPRQRRRFQAIKRQERKNRILLACVLFLAGVLLISISFNVSKFSSSVSEDVASLDEGAVSEPSEDVADAEVSEDVDEGSMSMEDAAMMEALNDDGSDNEKPVDGDTSFCLTALGDIMCSEDLAKSVSSGASFDFSSVFEEIKYYTQVGDLVVGNLEACFAGNEKGFKSSKTFNAPDSLASNLKSIGVDVISTANNHCLDFGFDGVVRTIDVLDGADIPHVGTYKSQAERDSILFKYAKGVKVAFLSYSYGSAKSLKVPADKGFCVNLIDKDLIAADAKRAKDQGADVVVACMHWGSAYQSTPNKEQQELTDFLFQNGVDVIFGSNPHVLQSMEKRTVSLADGSSKDGFVVYSLGTFVGNLKSEAILNLKLTKHADGGVSISGADYVPIYISKVSSGKGKNVSNSFKILDIERNILAYDAGDLTIGSSLYEVLKKQLDRVKGALGAEF